MKSIYRLQYKVLAFACNPRAALPFDDRSVFTRKFGARWGEWLFERLNRSEKFSRALSNLINHVNRDSGKRHAILSAFLNDTGFHRRLQDESFVFQYRSLPPEAKNALGELMKLFYDDLLDSGFPTDPQNAGAKFTKSDFKRAFWAANTGMDLCPACDGPKPPSSRGVVQSENDHFFPKSSYPLLAVHGSNLLPICKYCNQSFKRSADPIERHDDKPLAQSFYPYELPAVEHIDINVSRPGAGEHLVAINAKDLTDADRVKNLNRLLDLQARWLDELKVVIGRLIEDMSELPNLRERIGEAIEDDLLVQMTKQLQTCQRKQGLRDGSLLNASYLQFAIGDQSELRELQREIRGIAAGYGAVS